MPRYFFHLSFGDRLLPDEEGVELASRVSLTNSARPPICAWAKGSLAARAGASIGRFGLIEGPAA